MRTIVINLILAIGLVGFGLVTAQGQPGRRESNRPNVATPGKNRQPVKPSRAPVSKPLQTANIVINASPSDTVLLMNGQQMAGPVFTGLKPGGYVLTARRVGYNEESRSITLVAGENAPINITLEPLRGRLSVTPNVSGAEITVRRVGVDQSASSVRFGNAVVDLNLEPGDYEVSLSKEGYRGVKRTITLEPAGTVYLEPQLTRWPTETNPPQPVAMSIKTSPAGKHVLVILQGSSQSIAASGVIDVVVRETAHSSNRVSGVLPGTPCSITIAPVINIGEYSLAERPDATNGWNRIAVKVRPKDRNRPAHFVISWETLAVESGTAGKGQEVPLQINAQFEPATIKKKVLPVYPKAARARHLVGTVIVFVDIDEKGKVVSAHATEGPSALRQAAESAAKQWEFNPAKKNGLSVRAKQRLVFNFVL